MREKTRLPDWSDEGYPDPERLRREVSCMTEAMVETLLDRIPRRELRGIYLKGSAKKRWDTPIDYVPEASDLDLHLWFREDGGEGAHFGCMDLAFDIQRGIEARYRAKCPRPIHVPRPQIGILNDMMRKPGFLHSPPVTVEVLFGEDCPVSDLSAVDEIKRDKCRDLLSYADIIDGLPLRIVDRPDKYLAELLRDLSFRVSPVGPIVLHLAGFDPMTVWSMNRTRVTQALRDAGHTALADDYADYFLARWRRFLSDGDDLDAVRDSVGAAWRVLERSVSVANSHLSQPEI